MRRKPLSCIECEKDFALGEPRLFLRNYGPLHEACLKIAQTKDEATSRPLSKDDLENFN